MVYPKMKYKAPKNEWGSCLYTDTKHALKYVIKWHIKCLCYLQELKQGWLIVSQILHGVITLQSGIVSRQGWG